MGAPHVCSVVAVGVNIIFLLLSLGITGYGISAAAKGTDDYSRITDWDIYIVDKLCIAIGIGGLFVAGTSFCCMGFDSKPVMLVHGFLWLALLVSMIATAAVIDGSATVETKVRSGMENTIGSYLSDGDVRKSWDGVQKDQECCGIKNVTDWIDSSPHFNATNPYPASCLCHVSPACDKTGTPFMTVFTHGCLSAVDDVVDARWSLWRGLASGLAVFLLLIPIAGLLGKNLTSRGYTYAHA